MRRETKLRQGNLGELGVGGGGVKIQQASISQTVFFIYI